MRIDLKQKVHGYCCLSLHATNSHHAASTKEWWNNIELISTFPISTHLVLIFQEHKRGFRTNWNALKTQRAGQEDSNNALVLRTEYSKLFYITKCCLREISSASALAADLPQSCSGEVVRSGGGGSTHGHH